MKKTGEFIANERKAIGMSQRALGDYLFVTDKAISKWERGLSCPDTENLKSIALLFNCSISEILNGERRDISTTSNLPAKASSPLEDNEKYNSDLRVEFDLSSNNFISSYLFGDNLEHTRDSVNGGISAELLKNRKFAGKPDRYGVANEWYRIGENAYIHFGEAYTKHFEGYRMIRSHECNSQVITNYNGEKSGIGQSGIFIKENTEYRFEIVCKAFSNTLVTLAIKNENDEICYKDIFEAKQDDFEEIAFDFSCELGCDNAKLEITFNSVGTLTIGAVSLMETQNFHGMRLDVIRQMKKLGIKLLRWPGGNFAGEYNWKDGLLPRNKRAPIQSFLWLETQPHTFGYDFSEINVDDFIALCKEIGAEAFITINPTWNTPDESAQWVEYCNGDENTEYGKLRAERGYSQPYNVQFWSLGNEFGYGHMEGANTPRDYSKAVSAHAEQMLKISPNLILCSSGPYPNVDWVENSAKPLSKIAPLVSLHHYAHYSEFINPEKRKEDYYSFINKVYTEYYPQIVELREQLPDHIKISLDEWNAWYAWYRPGSVTEGIFAATFMHMLFNQADKYGIFLACYFESVNEGSINVYPQNAKLTPTGRALSIMQNHANGAIVSLNNDFVATKKDDIITCTLINRSFDKNKSFFIPNVGGIITNELYSSSDVVPYSEFERSELKIKATDKLLEVIMPAHSISLVQISLK